MHRAHRGEPQLVDKSKAVNILTSVCPTLTEHDVTHVHRLGKKAPPKVRPLKVVLASPELALTILKKSKNTPAGLKIVSDRTPRQQEELALLHKELLRRQQEEPDLCIRYVNGAPKITKPKPTRSSGMPQGSSNTKSVLI